jgi:hypothetical protein
MREGGAMELHVGRGVVAGALTVFPVWNGEGGRRRYVTDLRQVVVAENEDGPSVPMLVADNGGRQPVLVLEGHLFEGGWQHRMAVTSVLLPPRRRTRVHVACVEERRWHGDRHQDSRGRRATPYVRSAASAPAPGGETQVEVWRRVESYRHGAPGGDMAGDMAGCMVGDMAGAPAGDTASLLTHLYRSEANVRGLVRDLRPLPGQAGVLVALSGQPLMLEVFDDERTLREQFDSIIAAAGLDALGQPPVATPGRRARRLVERLERVRLSRSEHGDGASRSVGRDADLDVSVLAWQERPVHLRATYLRHPMLAGA